jgi:hypothetical protein
VSREIALLVTFSAISIGMAVYLSSMVPRAGEAAGGGDDVGVVIVTQREDGYKLAVPISIKRTVSELRAEVRRRQQQTTTKKTKVTAFQGMSTTYAAVAPAFSPSPTCFTHIPPPRLLTPTCDRFLSPPLYPTQPSSIQHTTTNDVDR